MQAILEINDNKFAFETTKKAFDVLELLEDALLLEEVSHYDKFNGLFKEAKLNISLTLTDIEMASEAIITEANEYKEQRYQKYLKEESQIKPKNND